MEPCCWSCCPAAATRAQRRDARDALLGLFTLRLELFLPCIYAPFTLVYAQITLSLRSGVVQPKWPILGDPFTLDLRSGDAQSQFFASLDLRSRLRSRLRSVRGVKPFRSRLRSFLRSWLRSRFAVPLASLGFTLGVTLLVTLDRCPIFERNRERKSSVNGL